MFCGKLGAEEMIGVCACTLATEIVTDMVSHQLARAHEMPDVNDAFIWPFYKLAEVFFRSFKSITVRALPISAIDVSY